MEVNFAPETERKLRELAGQSGPESVENLVRDVVEGYFSEIGDFRRELETRYDSLKTGTVRPIPGNEVSAYFREKSGAARRS